MANNNRERQARQREARSRSARATQAMISNPIENRASASMRVLPGVSIRDISVRRRNAVGAVRYVADRGLAIGGFLVIVFALLLLTNIIADFRNTEPRTLMSFLEAMQSDTMPTISLSWLNWTEMTITGDWGVMTPLQDLLNSVIGIVNVFAFIGTSLINAIIWIVWFIKWVIFGI